MREKLYCYHVFFLILEFLLRHLVTLQDMGQRAVESGLAWTDVWWLKNSTNQRHYRQAIYAADGTCCHGDQHDGGVMYGVSTSYVGRARGAYSNSGKGQLLHSPSLVAVGVSVVDETWACFLSLARSKLRLSSANHRAGYFSNLACDWLSIVWAYSEQETENGPWSPIGMVLQAMW